MTRFEKRNPSGQLVKGTLNIDKIEIDITPGRNTTRIEIKDKKKNMSVSMNINQFRKMVDGLKYIEGCHNEFHPNNTSSKTNKPQPTPARTDKPQPTPARTNEPQSTPARTDEPQPTSARTNRPQPTPARTDEPQLTSARTDEPQPTSARTNRPQPTPARTNEPQSTPARTDETQPVPNPNLAQRHETIPKQRKRACNPQLSQDEPLAKRSRVDLKSGKVGDNAAIPTPIVDRGRGDSLVTNCDVNVNCTVTVGQAVKATTPGGQGFCRCDGANGNKQCQNNRCTCVKGGNLCNSRCHNGVMCKNK